MIERYLVGDIDGDNEVDQADVDLVNSGPPNPPTFAGSTCASPAPLTAVQFARADADGNCAITVEDVKLVEEIVTEGGLVGTSPRKELAWDAENRLIKVEPVGTGVTINDKKVEFKYDHQGRRFEKKVSAWVSGAWAHSYTQRFVWGSSPAGNGWLMLMVVNGSGGTGFEPVRRFTWGRDLSGHGGGSSGSSSGGTGLQPVALLTGAGGIGGLLAVYDNDLAGTGATTFQFAFMYDANGNVGQVNDYTQTTAAAAMVAKYGYDAYGNVNSKSGTYADTNTFRFSTKFWDTETNLGYWGYRYYDAGLGRWISRDPIEEDGGFNIYQCSGNSLTNYVDALGNVPGDTDGGATAGTCTLKINVAAAAARRAIDALRNMPCNQISGAIDAATAALTNLRLLLESLAACPGYLHLPFLDNALNAAATAAKMRCGMIAIPEKLTDIATCKGLHAAYSNLGCSGCTPCMNKDKAAANAACLSTEIAGRTAYLTARCDYVLDHGGKKTSADAEKGHLQQLAEKSAALLKCLAAAAK